MSFEHIIRSLEAAQAEVIKFANSKGRDIYDLEKVNAAQMSRIQDLEADNAVLRKAARQAVSTVKLEHPFPKGFTATVTFCSTPEKAAKNVAFYNPGTPFEGDDVFVYPDPCPKHLSPNAVLRLVYDPTTPEGCIEMGMFQREYFGVAKSASVKFLPAGAIPEITSCKIRVSRINQNGTTGLINTSTRGDGWAPILDGMVGVVDCPLVINDLVTYRVIPVDIRPSSAGIFTKDTKLTVVLENERNIVC